MSEKLIKLLGICRNSVVSLVGAGGKTTSMYRLAGELSATGLTVLVTTTTKIFSPAFEGRKNVELFLGQPDALCDCFRRNESSIIVGAESLQEKTNKLVGYSVEQIDRLHSNGVFDVILVEADGAKRKPIKAPAEHEPVICGSTTLLVGFIGLDCLDRPLDDQTVHRAENLVEISQQPISSIIGEETLISLIVSPVGLFKGIHPGCRSVLILNKADSPALKRRGLSIIQSLQERYAQRNLPDDFMCLGIDD